MINNQTAAQPQFLLSRPTPSHAQTLAGSLPHLGPTPAGWLALERFAARLSAAGFSSDLACAVIAEAMQAQQQRVRQLLGTLRLAGNAREVLGQRLGRLRQLKQHLQQKTDDNDEKITVGSEFADCRAKIDYDVDLESGRIAPRKTGDLCDDKGRASINGVDLEIKRLEDIAQRIDSQREVLLVELNDAIAKKGQYTQLISNVLKRKNDVARAIIGNV